METGIFYNSVNRLFCRRPFFRLRLFIRIARLNDGGEALIVCKAEVLVNLFVIHDAAAFPDHADAVFMCEKLKVLNHAAQRREIIVSRKFIFIFF